MTEILLIAMAAIGSYVSYKVGFYEGKHAVPEAQARGKSPTLQAQAGGDTLLVSPRTIHGIDSQTIMVLAPDPASSGALVCSRNKLLPDVPAMVLKFDDRGRFVGMTEDWNLLSFNEEDVQP